MGHKISEQAKPLWKEQVPHPLLNFLDSNNHAAFTVTQAGLDNAVGSASDCRSRFHEYASKPCHIIVVKANHKINLLPFLPFHCLKNGNCHLLADVPALSLRRSVPVQAHCQNVHWPVRHDLYCVVWDIIPEANKQRSLPQPQPSWACVLYHSSARQCILIDN